MLLVLSVDATDEGKCVNLSVDALHHTVIVHSIELFKPSP
jgi:hypothetical protein